MPGKFLANPGKSGGKKNILLIVLIVVLVAVLGAGGVLLYLRMSNENANVNQAATNTNTAGNGNTNASSNANTVNGNTNGNGNTNANANTNSSLPTIVKGSFSDPETNEKTSTATLTLPPGSVPTSVTTVGITALSAKLGAYANSTMYQAVAAVYVITPSGTKLLKDATLEISYTESELLKLGFTVKESELTLASWSQNEWVPLNSLVDTKQNLVTTEIDQFYTDGIAIVAKKPSSTNTNTTRNTNSSNGRAVTPSLDSDGDGLTNQEEVLYGTNAGSADTDLDSFKDGQELLGLYNPNGSGRLITSSLVRAFENTTYRYSLYVPTSWTVGTLNADKLVTFTSISGEFVQVSVQDNAGKLSAREWYLSLNPSVDQSELRDITAGALTGVLGPDGLNIFLADQQSIYQITYNIGIKTEADYLSTFTMMYTSFIANIIPSGTNGNTNTPTNGNTNGSVNTNSANSNTNTANANTNGS